MRMRLLGLAAVVALALPLAGRAQDKGPSLVIKLKSIDGIIADAKYLAELAGKGEDFKNGMEILGALKTEQGLGGIDTKRPIGIYGSFAENVQESPAVVLIPIVDEKAFVQLLETYEVKVKKEDDGVSSATHPAAPIPFYFRFANKYVYITPGDKAHIAKEKLLAPEKVLADDASVLTLSAKVADIPDAAKQLILGQLDNALAAAKEKKDDKEPEFVTKMKGQIAEHIGQRIKSILSDGDAVTLRIAIDSAKDDVTVDASFKAKPGSALAKDMEAASKGQSLFAGLAGKGDALSGNVTVTLPEEVKKVLAPAVDEAIKKAVEEEKDQVKKALMKAGMERLAPTLKAGDLDAGVSLRGPDSAGHFTAVAGIHVKDGKGLEGFLRDVVKNMPDKDKANIALDADSAGDVKIHKLTIDNMEADMKAMFGSPNVFVAARDDAIIVALGPDALAAIKSAAGSKATSSRMVNLNVSVGRLAAADKKDAGAAKVAKEVFGANPTGDTVTVAVEMDQAVKLRVVVKGKVIAFGVKSQDTQAK